MSIAGAGHNDPDRFQYFRERAIRDCDAKVLLPIGTHDATLNTETYLGGGRIKRYLCEDHIFKAQRSDERMRSCFAGG